MRKDQISVQLYTIREITANDWDAALGSVAGAGYKAVEFAGFHGKSASDLRQMLDKHGLTASSAHIPLPDFQTRLDGVVEDLLTIGAQWGIVPWVAPEDRSEEALRSMAAQFDGFATRLQDAALKFGYHNHDFEFTTKSAHGKTVFDQMIEVTTPGLVHFEIDAYWVAVGGYDPAKVIADNADRVALIHLKDGFTSDLHQGKDVPFGEGNLDWDGILAASRAAGVEWYVTEQDTPNPDDPIGEIATAYRNAENMAE